ncbi:MAG: HD domain-containing protein [Syntrophomonadaceae bacterium]|nr:HD domain-containing protein [Syntrophomonadaceae bacterium]
MERKGPLEMREARMLGPGEQFWGKYLISEKVQRLTRDGKNMYNLKLVDSTGEMDAVVWENCQLTGELEAGKVANFLGDVSVFNGKNQLTAKKIKVVDDDYRAFLPAPPIDLAALKAEFKHQTERVSDPYLKALLNHIFTPEVRERFFEAPAAKRVHHNYRGGLLEHSLSVCRQCLNLAEGYPYLNRDLLIAGALLHDIGKMEEFEIEFAPRYTMTGKLLGHISIGAELVTRAIRELKAGGLDFPAVAELMITHMVISHHGTLEYGSPVVPMFPEAMVLHNMDRLDAHLFVFHHKAAEGGGEDEWFTPYDNFFGQQFFTYRYAQTEDKE